MDNYKSQPYYGPPEPVPNPLKEALNSSETPTPTIDAAIRRNIDPTWSSEECGWSRSRSNSNDDMEKFWHHEPSIPEGLKIKFSQYNKKLLKKLKCQQYIIDQLNIKVNNQEERIDALSNALKHSL